jgi:hypothetical protein
LKENLIEVGLNTSMMCLKNIREEFKAVKDRFIFHGFFSTVSKQMRQENAYS